MTSIFSWRQRYAGQFFRLNNRSPHYTITILSRLRRPRVIEPEGTRLCYVPLSFEPSSKKIRTINMGAF